MRSIEDQKNELVNYRKLLVLQYGKFLLTIVLGLLFAFQYYKGSPPVVLALTAGTLVTATVLLNLGAFCFLRAFCFLKPTETLLYEILFLLPYAFIWNGATARGILAFYLCSWTLMQIGILIYILSYKRYLKREDEKNKEILASVSSLTFERPSASDGDTQ